MYIYLLGWYNDKYTCNHTLSHKTKMSRSKFTYILHKTIEQIIKEHTKVGRPLHSIKEVWRELIFYLCKDKGFIDVKITQNWMCYADSSIFTNDYNERADDELVEIRDYLNKRGYGVQMDTEYKKYFIKERKENDK